MVVYICGYIFLSVIAAGLVAGFEFEMDYCSRNSPRYKGIYEIRKGTAGAISILAGIFWPITIIYYLNRLLVSMFRDVRDDLQDMKDRKLREKTKKESEELSEVRQQLKEMTELMKTMKEIGNDTL